MRLPLSISPIRGLRSEDNPLGYARIVDADGRFVCKVEEQQDAERIVSSVNAFDALAVPVPNSDSPLALQSADEEAFANQSAKALGIE